MLEVVDSEITLVACKRCGKAMATVRDTLVCPPCDEARAAFRNDYVGGRFMAAAKHLRLGDGDANGFGPPPEGESWYYLDHWLAPRGLVLHGMFQRRERVSWQVVRLRNLTAGEAYDDNRKRLEAAVAALSEAKGRGVGFEELRRLEAAVERENLGD